jgi:hypothetical protein
MLQVRLVQHQVRRTASVTGELLHTSHLILTRVK